MHCTIIIYILYFDYPSQIDKQVGTYFTKLFSCCEHTSIDKIIIEMQKLCKKYEIQQKLN